MPRAPGGTERGRLRALNLAGGFVHDDAVLAAGVGGAELLLQDVLAHPLRVSVERVTPPARARQDVAEDIAPAHRDRAFPRQLARLAAGIQ